MMDGMAQQIQSGGLSQLPRVPLSDEVFGIGPYASSSASAAANPLCPIDLDGSSGMEQALSAAANNPILTSILDAPASEWSRQEDETLMKLAQDSTSGTNWKLISAHFPLRSEQECVQRWRKISSPIDGKQGPWASDEDSTLYHLVMQYGPSRWTEISKILNEKMHQGKTVRLGRQCRERWYNHLDPTIRRGGWTHEEDAFILQKQAELGNRWAEIAKQLHGRTENAVKNRFNSLMNKNMRAISTSASGSAGSLTGGADSVAAAFAMQHYTNLQASPAASSYNPYLHQPHPQSYGSRPPPSLPPDKPQSMQLGSAPQGSPNGMHMHVGGGEGGANSAYSVNAGMGVSGMPSPLDPSPYPPDGPAPMSTTSSGGGGGTDMPLAPLKMETSPPQPQPQPQPSSASPTTSTTNTQEGPRQTGRMSHHQQLLLMRRQQQQQQQQQQSSQGINPYLQAGTGYQPSYEQPQQWGQEGYANAYQVYPPSSHQRAHPYAHPSAADYQHQQHQYYGPTAAAAGCEPSQALTLESRSQSAPDSHHVPSPGGGGTLPPLVAGSGGSKAGEDPASSSGLNRHRMGGEAHGDIDETRAIRSAFSGGLFYRYSRPKRKYFSCPSAMIDAQATMDKERSQLKQHIEQQRVWRQQKLAARNAARTPGSDAPRDSPTELTTNDEMSEHNVRGGEGGTGNGNGNGNVVVSPSAGEGQREGGGGDNT
ncbi:unnamed protein product [Vitrella brassicaformis CCMP3155]|uniref:Uncharacterized protein n=1 Tax=Vitrella brassicaformis (strain CCMP3155) TaxID=1169540 RepID=A0A0G4GAG3_VITBC|nr:unnamed protein product [Vitrella brassicaformis CCMP3155]|eukprot:CEM25708.1 unnamed protein product [Vitrella brassicaformis CCMP3155]